jgi:hypothetical protein
VSEREDVVVNSSVMACKMVVEQLPSLGACVWRTHASCALIEVACFVIVRVAPSALVYIGEW